MTARELITELQRFNLDDEIVIKPGDKDSDKEYEIVGEDGVTVAEFKIKNDSAPLVIGEVTSNNGHRQRIAIIAHHEN